MKKNIILVFILASLLIANNKSFAQREIKIDDRTYRCDTTSTRMRMRIQNVNNELMKTIPLGATCRIGVTEITPSRDIYKSIFSEERAKELANSESKSIPILTLCNLEGQILEVSFSIKNDRDIKPSELKALEDAFKNYRVEIRVLDRACSGPNYYYVVFPFRPGGLYKK